jgi:hypothetical protein
MVYQLPGILSGEGNLSTIFEGNSELVVVKKDFTSVHATVLHAGKKVY